MGLKYFTPNDAGMKAILVSPEVGAVLLGIMKEGQAFAEEASADFAVSGHYASSFETTLAIGTNGDSPPRTTQVATLRNTASYSLDVEYGFHGRAKSETRTAHNVLRRTRSALHA